MTRPLDIPPALKELLELADADLYERAVIEIAGLLAAGQQITGEEEAAFVRDVVESQDRQAGS